jgi:hypothetical protein
MRYMRYSSEIEVSPARVIPLDAAYAICISMLQSFTIVKKRASISAYHVLVLWPKVAS